MGVDEGVQTSVRGTELIFMMGSIKHISWTNYSWIMNVSPGLSEDGNRSPTCPC